MFSKLITIHGSYTTTHREFNMKHDPEARYRPTPQMLLDALRSISITCSCENQDEKMIEEQIKMVDAEGDNIANAAYQRCRVKFDNRIKTLRKKLKALEIAGKKKTESKKSAVQKLILQIKVQGSTPANCKAVEKLLG